MARFDLTVKELTKLKAMTRPRSQDQDDFDVQIASMAGLLSDIPDLALEDGCASWAQNNQWFPTLMELRDECLRFAPATPRKTHTALDAPVLTPNSRLRNAWGLREIKRLMSAEPKSQPAEWDAVRAKMDDMRREDTVP